MTGRLGGVLDIGHHEIRIDNLVAVVKFGSGSLREIAEQRDFPAILKPGLDGIRGIVYAAACRHGPVEHHIVKISVDHHRSRDMRINGWNRSLVSVGLHQIVGCEFHRRGIRVCLLSELYHSGIIVVYLQTILIGGYRTVHLDLITHLVGAGWERA